MERTGREAKAKVGIREIGRKFQEKILPRNESSVSLYTHTFYYTLFPFFFVFFLC